MDQKQHIFGIFVDVKKKAFDTIFTKLERYGIRGLVLQWVRSYVSGRKQFVRLDNYCSKVWALHVVSLRGQCWDLNYVFFTLMFFDAKYQKYYNQFFFYWWHKSFLIWYWFTKTNVWCHDRIELIKIMVYCYQIIIKHE